MSHKQVANPAIDQEPVERPGQTSSTPLPQPIKTGVLPKLCVFAALALSSQLAAAHIIVHELPLTSHGRQLQGLLTTVNLASVADTWAYPAKWPQLTDVMTWRGAPVAVFFHLDQDALVNLSTGTVAGPLDTNSQARDRNTWSAAVMDPAFSVYQGGIPSMAMDFGSSTDYDPIAPSDDQGYPKLSIRDARPDDPNISQIILTTDLDDQGNPVIDPNTGLPARIVNPEWTRPFAELAPNHPDNANLQALAITNPDMTPEQWYSANYVAHNGYRDTLNFSTTGGLFQPGEQWTDPFSGQQFASVGQPRWGYFGEFDPLGDWSIANGMANCVNDSACMAAHPDYDPATMTLCQTTDPTAGDYCVGGNPAGVDWVKLVYKASANRFDGETEGSADTVTWHQANTTTENAHNLLLSKGDYTVLIGGGCTDCITPSPFNDPPQYTNDPFNEPLLVSSYKSASDTTSDGTDINSSAGLNLSLNAWPVAACDSGAKASKPQLAPVSGPWDVEAGQSLSLPITAHHCGQAVAFTSTGLTGANLSTAVNDSQSHGWSTQLDWTAGDQDAGKTYTLRIQAKDANVKGQAQQQAQVRVWPKGISPSNAFDVKAPKAKWNAAKNRISFTASIGFPLKKPILLKAEKQALFGHFLALRDANNQWFGTTDVMASATGQIKLNQLLDAAMVPCEVTWTYKGKTGKIPVASAPAKCVK